MFFLKPRLDRVICLEYAIRDKTFKPCNTHVRTSRVASCASHFKLEVWSEANKNLVIITSYHCMTNRERVFIHLKEGSPGLQLAIIETRSILTDNFIMYLLR